MKLFSNIFQKFQNIQCFVVLVPARDIRKKTEFDYLRETRCIYIRTSRFICIVLVHAQQYVHTYTMCLIVNIYRKTLRIPDRAPMVRVGGGRGVNHDFKFVCSRTRLCDYRFSGGRGRENFEERNKEKKGRREKI